MSCAAPHIGLGFHSNPLNSLASQLVWWGKASVTSQVHSAYSCHQSTWTIHTLIYIPSYIPNFFLIHWFTWVKQFKTLTIKSENKQKSCHGFNQLLGFLPLTCLRFWGNYFNQFLVFFLLHVFVFHLFCIHVTFLL